MKPNLYIVIIAFVFPVVAWGQDSLTVEQYKEKVVEYSRILKQNREQVLAADYGRKTAKTGYLPKIDFTANASLDLTQLRKFSGAEGEYRNNTYIGALQLNQPLFGGLGIQSRYKAAKLGVEIAQETERLTIDNIVYEAYVVYWQAAANKAYMEIMKEFYSIVKAQENIIGIRFKDGMIGRTDLLMIQTRLKEAELQYSIAQNNYLISMHNLNILMGVSPDTDTHLSNAINASVWELRLFSFNDVLARRPDYKIAQLDIMLQKQNLKTAMSGYNPQLGFSLSGGWGTSQINYGFPPEFTGLAALALKIPVFYFGEKRYVRRSNEAALIIKQLEQSRVNDQILNQYSNAITNLKQSSTQIELSNQTLNIAKENLDLATFSYNEGKIPIVEVLSAQLSWINAYSGMVSAYLSYKVAVAEYQKISALYSTPQQ